MIIRGTPTSSKLTHIYNTKEEIEKLKKDEKNIFLERGK